MKVYRIPARSEQRHKRVATYCRVSTTHDEQFESFETQVEHYKRFIRSNPNWTLVKVYADQGMSGVNMSKRPAFQQMMRDALGGGIDLILVKSISRFSRNIVDCQRCVAELKDHGVEVRFEREGISTFDPASDFVFSLLSAVAQDESRSISENIKWSCRRRFERGEYRLGNNRILGYDADPATHRLVPNADAWMIRRIFERFTEGASYAQIARELNAAGAKRMRSKAPVSASMVQYIVSNETYVGDKLLQKAPPADFLTHRPDRTARYQSYYLKSDHEGIIDRATWQKAQALLERRRQEAALGVGRSRADHHVFYGKVYCGECGRAYHRRTVTVNTQSGSYRYRAWSCCERKNGMKGSGCAGRSIREQELERTIADALGWAEFDAAGFDREVEQVVVTRRGVRLMMRDGEIAIDKRVRPIQGLNMPAGEPLRGLIAGSGRDRSELL